MEMWFSEFHTPDVKHSIRVNRQLYSKQSDYQRIDIFETPEFGRVLTLDGNVMLTERDEFIYDEMITHVPMSVHRSAKDILVIGAGDGGVVRELTRYDRVERNFEVAQALGVRCVLQTAGHQSAQQLRATGAPVVPDVLAAAQYCLNEL